MTEILPADDEVFQRFLAAPDDVAVELDPDDVSLAIIGRILQAETAEDILGGGGAIHARDYLLRPFTLTDVRFNRGDFTDNGPGFYALLEGADPDGVKVIITCGARNVLAQAWRLRDIGALPIQVQLEESERPTARGYKVMWLAAAPSPF
jgi:hypothetical protein